MDANHRWYTLDFHFHHNNDIFWLIASKGHIHKHALICNVTFPELIQEILKIRQDITKKLLYEQFIKIAMKDQDILFLLFRVTEFLLRKILLIQ